ncbi:MAG: hypothetical protein KatS3mg110_1885 [Pirellulaceae bacterium]|nr:MAG: hypothetical protein KatS3mg110_1885 [Pirellulaceae bacterium]
MPTSKDSTKRHSLMWIAVVILAGVLLIWLPPQIVDYVERIRRLAPAWAAIYLVLVLFGVLCLVAGGVWGLLALLAQSRRHRQEQQRRMQSPQELNLEDQVQEFREHLEDVRQLVNDPRVPEQERRRLHEMLQRLEQKHSGGRLEIVAFGTISSGKSALLNQLAGRPVFQVDIRGGTTQTANRIPWPDDERVILVDTPGLGEIEGEAHMQAAMDTAATADLVLLVVDGPLRDFEYTLLARLRQMGKRVLICLNKSDWYKPEDLELLRGQIVEQVSAMVDPRDVVAVAVQPVPRTVVRVEPDGTERQEVREEPPRLEPLAQRLLELLRDERQQLLMANLLLQARGMTAGVRAEVARLLAAQAAATVDKYAWAAATAVAVSPFLVDLLAAGGLSAKMIIDVAAVFNKRLDMNAAATLLKQMAASLASTLGVSIVTPALLSIVGSLLKSIPGAGTLAGGALQAVVQLLLVRWVGRVATRYYEQEYLGQQRSLAELAAEEWKQITAAASLRKLVAEYREGRQTTRTNG